MKTIGKIPDSSQAEKWITPDIFLFEKKLYEIKLNGEIVRLK